MGQFGISIIADDVLKQFADRLAALADGRVRVAEARALNHTGDKAYTAVRHALVEQTSASRALIDEALKKTPASTNKGGSTALHYEIGGSGRALPLREFGAVQFSKGVRAKVWGRLQTYRHTFIVDRLSSQVFVRTGRSRLPIRLVYGPSIAKELVKDQSLAAFEKTAKELNDRVMHELQRLLIVPSK